MRPGVSSYPIPISLPEAVAVHRPPNQAIRGDTRLCSVLERIAGGDKNVRNTLHGLPWLTPIVGSGCLQLGDGPTINLEGLGKVAGAEAERLLGDSNLSPGQRFDVLAERFAQALHRSRTHGDVGLENGAVTPSAAAARLTVLTALLTRLYHLVAMHDAAPMGWYWVAERISMGEAATEEESVREHLLPAVKRLLEGMLTIDAESFQVPPAALLERVKADLTSSEMLSVSDLRLLTELTWIELIRGTPIYPGWSDLLLELLVELSSDDGVFEGYRPQIVKLQKLDETVARVLTRPTWRSWCSRSEPGGSLHRDQFYDAVARVLRAQAKIHDLLHPEEPSDEPDDDEYAELMERRKQAEVAKNEIVQDTNRKRQDAESPRLPPELDIPHPASYVTSFDLELEMALWATGDPFRIVLPVLAKSERRVDAELLWLTILVDPASDVDLPCYPIEDEAPWESDEEGDGRSVADREALWRSLRALRAATRGWQLAPSALAGKGGEEAGGWCPVVVRVTGSPLMVLPPVTGALRTELLSTLGYAGEEQLDITHALTIDEYTSVRQSEHELYFATSNEQRGLPTPLSLGTDAMERVWVGLGVQVDDPAIRLRMFTQLSAASMVKRLTLHARSASQGDSSENGASQSAATESLRVRGLAVNRRLDESQSNALRWLGFEFAVDGSVAELTPDIAHCARHYEDIADTLRDVADNGPPKEDGQVVDIRWGRPRNDSCGTWRRDHPRAGRKRR